ncbi:MAG TPA: TonB-dependent receptor [Woeseiaceae bacterium]|nr:TonB-dependent receptor [Woeseiaceae bacterium]
MNDHSRRGRRSAGGAALWLVLVAAACAPGVQAEPADLFELSIEELGELRVTSASRRSEPVRTAASAVFVITAEDIRRSGLTTVPEVLRLAPGVEVARNGAHSWTISIRGFNSDLSNKLLVLIDGRSVYSPLFAGVFWDAEDTLLQDIERIEVISGPGGTLWGTNAVNGVINIITRSAWDTQGSLVDIRAGNEERISADLRHGFKPAENIAARAYLKVTDRDASELPAGGNAFDEWQRVQGGFRLDWDRARDERITLQGDVYTAELSDLLRGDFTLGTLPGPDAPGDVDISGFNLLARWEWQPANESTIQLQAYFDHTSREIPGSFNEARDTLDIDFHQQLAAGQRHTIVWGGGFRSTSDDLDNTLFATFVPEERTDQTFSLFVEDRIALTPDSVFLTLGAKLEHNDYTDFEFQPNVRLSWLVNERQTLWAAISRAVRIPARLNTDLHLTAPVDVPELGVPLYVMVDGNDDFQSEELIATELGYRVRFGESLSLDLAFFYNDYDNLMTQEAGDLSVVGDPPEYLVLPATQQNGMKGDSYGGTVVANWQPTDYWRVQFQYARVEVNLELEPGSQDTGALNVAGNSPENQAAIHTSLELPHNLDFYTGIRYVDRLTGVPDYTLVDVSLGWRPIERLRISLTVRGLNDDSHLEFAGSNLIESSAFARATWTF